MTGPVGAAEQWAVTAHLVSPAYPPQLEAVRQARGFVRTQLESIGLEGCADDAGLMVSELAANAVLHARSEFTIHLRPTLEGGVRVEVHDRSPWPPVLTAPSESAMSGRGLDLVATMATRWGSHPLLAPDATPDATPDGSAAEEGPGHEGKMVWFEVEPTGSVPVVEANTEELLALWSDEEDGKVVARAPGGAAAAAGATPASSASGTRTGRTAGIITSSMAALEPTCDVVVPGLPVSELLAAKEAMDDLLRELQLLLLATPAHGTHLAPAGGSSGGSSDGSPGAPADRDAQLEEERATAARLDAAARAFEQGRRQVREQVTRAAARGEEVVVIRLSLPASARQAAARYRDAVEAAGDLSRTGHLITLSDGLERHTQVRRHYLDEVIRQLPAGGA